ncbi:MAG: hypothetical protein AAF677_17075, partial [Pseudomonadota bacterium]
MSPGDAAGTAAGAPASVGARTLWRVLTALPLLLLWAILARAAFRAGPPFGPDELAHYGYALEAWRHGVFPALETLAVRDPTAGDAAIFPGYLGHPPFFYLLVGGLTGWAEDGMARLTAMRLLSSALAVASLAGYAAVLWLRVGPRAAAFFALAAATAPFLLVQGAFLTNDVFALAAGALLFAGACRPLAEHRAHDRGLALMLLGVALAMACKPTAAIQAGAVVVTILSLAAWRHGLPRPGLPGPEAPHGAGPVGAGPVGAGPHGPGMRGARPRALRGAGFGVRLILPALAIALAAVPYVWFLAQYSSPAPATEGTARLVAANAIFPADSDQRLSLAAFAGRFSGWLLLGWASNAHGLLVAVLPVWLLVLGALGLVLRREGLSGALGPVAVALAVAALAHLAIHFGYAWQRHLATGGPVGAHLRYYLPLLPAALALLAAVAT